MLRRMHDLIQDESQFIIATHSPILMAYPNAQILSAENALQPISYTETEHFVVARSFLNNHEKMIKEILAE
jgi:predicted ATPase